MSESPEERVERIEAETRRRELLAAVDEVNRRASQDESLTVEGMGFKGKVIGDKIIYVVLAILIAVALGYLINSHEANAKARAEQLADHDKMLLDGQRKIQDALGSVAYILTLDDAQRKALKLDMPESLRRQLDAPRR